MIRDVLANDRDGLFNLILKTKTKFNRDKCHEIIEKASKILVYQEGVQLLGVGTTLLSTNEAGEKAADISIFVDPHFRKKGIGTKLYDELETYLIEEAPDFLRTYMDKEHVPTGSFFEKMGFHKWWGSPELYYDGGLLPDSEVEFTAYEDRFFNQFLKVNQDCYYPVQKSNDLKPYITTPEIVEKYKLNNKKNVYVALDKDEIMASVTLGDCEIDNLIVAPNYQGMGLGRKALQFGMNKLLKQGYKEVRICYMENNLIAENLYYSLGFKFLNCMHVYRKFL